MAKAKPEPTEFTPPQDSRTIEIKRVSAEHPQQQAQPIIHPLDPATDPITMKALYDRAIASKLELLERRMFNLEIMWQRILNVSRESPLQPPFITGQPSYSAPPAPAMDPLKDWSDLKPAQPLMQAAGKSQTDEKPKPKKSSTNKIVIYAVVFIVVLAVIYMLYLYSHGYVFFWSR